MQVTRGDRGFRSVTHPVYPPGADKDDRVVTQSSAVGDYDDSWARPGSSYLWVGVTHHLDREEVRQLVRHLEAWLATGSLELPADEGAK